MAGAGCDELLALRRFAEYATKTIVHHRQVNLAFAVGNRRDAAPVTGICTDADYRLRFTPGNTVVGREDSPELLVRLARFEKAVTLKRSIGEAHDLRPVKSRW